jgi:hypothetical protein
VNQKRRHNQKYPWHELGEGESFFVPTEAGKPRYDAHISLASSARSWSRRNGRKFAVRVVEGGVRVWRTE